MRRAISLDIKRSTQRGCCRFAISANRSEGGIRILSRPLSPTVSFEATAVLIYLFRDEGTDNLALTIDVTGQNIPPITPSTDWLFVEAINTPQILGNRRSAHPYRHGDLALAQPQRVPQSQNFANLPHRRSLGGHRTSLASAQKEAACVILFAASERVGPNP